MSLSSRSRAAVWWRSLLILADLCYHQATDERQLKFVTESWTAPEVQPDSQLASGEDLRATDIYSFGLLCWRIINDGRNPFTVEPFSISGANIDQMQAAKRDPGFVEKVQLSLRVMLSSPSSRTFWTRVIDCTLPLDPSHRSLSVFILSVGQGTGIAAHKSGLTTATICTTANMYSSSPSVDLMANSRISGAQPTLIGSPVWFHLLRWRLIESANRPCSHMLSTSNCLPETFLGHADRICG